MQHSYGDQIIIQGNQTCHGSGNGQKLRDIFSKEVTNNRIAWYIDYFTEDGGNFSVRYLVEDGPRTVMMTNENKERRDPDEKWEDDDVAPWFFKDGKENSWIFMFSHPESLEIFGIHCEARLVFAFGSRSLMLNRGNMWETYMKDGILGPMKLCHDPQKIVLEAVAANPRVDFLDKYNLRQEYLLGMAVAIDE